MRWLTLCLVLFSCSIFRNAKQNHEFKKNPPGTIHLRHNLYIDKIETANVHWREYIFWTVREDSANLEKVLPDTLVWRSDTAYNESLVNITSVTRVSTVIQLLAFLMSKLLLFANGEATE